MTKDNNIVYTDTMKRESLYRFGKNDFSMPELEYINQAAYWDYQREKIYVRSSPQLKRVSRRSARGRAKTLPVNRIIECSPPNSCPKCKSPNIIKYGKASKIVHDLKFSRVGIRRWIVRYLFHRNISVTNVVPDFGPEQRHWTRSKLVQDCYPT